MAKKTKIIEKSTDVLVIGAGPGGYTAAFRASDLGKSVICVDAQEQPGGVCLNQGCIPSKALLHVVKVITEAAEAEMIGLKFSKPKITLSQVRQWKSGILKGQAAGVLTLAKNRNVEMIVGRAVFEDSTTVVVDGKSRLRIKFQHAILATGSRPATIPGLMLDTPKLWNSSSALELQEIPKRLLVIGGGYIGLELSTVYAALGSKVTVVEMMKGLLPGVDRDLVRPLEKRIANILQGLFLETRVEKLEETSTGLRATFVGKTQKSLIFDTVLIAVGRVPNSSGNGLDNTSVEINEKGFVKVDKQQRTADPHIFAIGDLVGDPMLAHKASYEAKVAAEVIVGRNVQNDAKAIPAVVFTDPEIAWCGLTETEAKEQGVDVQVHRFPWLASGRAATIGRQEGITKILSDPTTNKILGLGITGVGAGELIAEGVLAIELGSQTEDLELTIHPHPTLTETISEVASVSLGSSIHYYAKKR